MATGIKVNPPPQARLPEKILKDRELEPFFTYQQEYLFKLWKRTGGGVDFIFNIGVDIEALELRVTNLEARMLAAELRLDVVEARLDYLEGLTVVTSIDHTVDNEITGNQTIRCKAELTVTLTLEPNDRDKVVVKVGQKNTEVIIDGNGRNIETSPTFRLRRLNTKRQIGLDLEYSAEDDVWYTV